MSLSLDLAWAGLGTEKSNLKSSTTDQPATESGIESGSSSSSLLESTKQSVSKPIVTGAVYIPPQVSNIINVINGPETSVGSSVAVEMVVIYRGKVPMLNPVPYERHLRTRLMKMHVKSLQNNGESPFAVMRIDPESIKLYTMTNPRTCLFEIECQQLDLVKQSKKDVTFFYFATDSTGKVSFDETMAPSLGSNDNFSGYTCYAFHGNCPKTADKAHRLIKHFVDLKSKAQFYTLNQPNCYLSASKHVTDLKPTSQLPQASQHVSPIEQKSEPQALSNVSNKESNVDLLLNIDDFSDTSNMNSAVSMFDNLASTSTNKCTTETNGHSFIQSTGTLDLLGEILAPNVATLTSSFAKQHLNYSMHLPSVNPINAQPTTLANQINPFMSNNLNNPLFSKPKSCPVPSFLNLTSPPQMVPSAPLSAPLVPTKSAISQPNSSQPMPSTNPFGATNRCNGYTVSAYPQYPSASLNPFTDASNSQSNFNFGSEFNDFLSQTVKGHFKK